MESINMKEQMIRTPIKINNHHIQSTGLRATYGVELCFKKLPVDNSKWGKKTRVCLEFYRKLK